MCLTAWKAIGIQRVLGFHFVIFPFCFLFFIHNFFFLTAAFPDERGSFSFEIPLFFSAGCLFLSLVSSTGYWTMLDFADYGFNR